MSVLKKILEEYVNGGDYVPQVTKILNGMSVVVTSEQLDSKACDEANAIMNKIAMDTPPKTEMDVARMMLKWLKEYLNSVPEHSGLVDAMILVNG